MTALAINLATRADRCPHGFATTQHPALCSCPGISEGAEAMAASLSARPDDAAQVEAVVRRLAASGRPFSANDARQLHGVRGGVVGATFNALRAAGVIEYVGAEPSTDRGTHGKSVGLWQGVSPLARTG